MKKSYEEYLSILRAFVQDAVPEIAEITELTKLMNLAYINSTLGLVCCMFMKHPQLVPPESMPFVRKHCLHDIYLYTERAESMKALARKLDQNGIDLLLFKGFIVREYYPMPELRSFGDIDFVIRTADREKCDKLMKELGYESQVNWEPVYSYARASEYYEVHTNIMTVNVSDHADYIEYFSRLWEHTQPCETISGTHILEFTPEYHLLYLLTHIAKHISGSGAGIRMYLDIAFFLKRFGATLDWAWIEGELKALHFEDFFNVVLTAVQDWFGVESPLPLRPIAPQTMADFLEYTMEGGTFGKVGRDNSIVYLKQQNPGNEDISKVQTLLHHAFPPKDDLKERYSYIKKHGWLLPVAWVQRLADSRKEWGRFAANTKSIITAKPDEVLKLKRIYKEIGL